MTLCRLIAPEWLMNEKPSKQKVLEGVFSNKQLRKYNNEGYNVYYLPNAPSKYEPGKTIDGSDVDTFGWVFVDCDLKDGVYADKDAFIEAVAASGLPPCKIVDSGHGIHAYWHITNLDANSYLRFQRRLTRKFNTDEAVGKIFQLMRLPGFRNTKVYSEVHEDQPLCILIYESNLPGYTAEELDKLLPPITLEDEEYCQRHYNKTYNLNQSETQVDEKIPDKFGDLLRENSEVKELWINNSDDRSKNDFRLASLLLAKGFTKEEAMSVLINCAKALTRAPIHRISYAKNIVMQFPFKSSKGETPANTSPTVRNLLARGEETITGTRFTCNRLIDDTVHGFRLGQVIGIVGGSGVGKTTLTLNTFLWFAEHNPDYHHFFFSLEQPAGEIANRIRTICKGNDSLFDQIHIISNYAENGDYVHFSIDMIEEHLLKFKQETAAKVGAVVVDHIGVLLKSDKNGESEGLIGICRRMKAVAVKVNMMLIMLSQAPREKAGIGDLELNKDAAFGTVFFESFLDYCICLWQPLKRVYHMGAPTIMAFKFGKIRHKKQGHDRIQEDVCYQLYFDPETELLRELTQEEETAAKYFVGQATTARKADRKADIVPYESRRVEKDPNGTTTNSH